MKSKLWDERPEEMKTKIGSNNMGQGPGVKR